MATGDVAGLLVPAIVGLLVDVAAGVPDGGMSVGAGVEGCCTWAVVLGAGGAPASGVGAEGFRKYRTRCIWSGCQVVIGTMGVSSNRGCAPGTSARTRRTPGFA